MRPIRRSRSAGGLLAVAFLIAASGCGADPDDGLMSPPATDATDIADEPVATLPPPTVTSAAVAVSAPFDAMLQPSEDVPVQWLVPWDDGFLAAASDTRHSRSPTSCLPKSPPCSHPR